MRVKIKRQEPVRETQMVSLADIAFLIIFFFMLTSGFMRDKLSVALPDLPKFTKTKSGLSVTMDGQKKIFLDGQPQASKEDLESGLRSRLAGKTEPSLLEVRFNCDKTLVYKDYQPVYQAISNAGGIICIIHDVRKP